MFALTRQEKILITLVLLSLVVGSIVKHYRQVYRERHPPAFVPPRTGKHAAASD